VRQIDSQNAALLMRVCNAKLGFAREGGRKQPTPEFLHVRLSDPNCGEKPRLIATTGV
jgi:hypothetical protein